ncbi:MAG: MCE family protein [Desulfuromonadales bacterium]|nr:MCE family protein [Desulfuromonadales bacterium]
MAKPVSKTLIGLFVVGAVILGVAAVALFGSGKFFASRPTYVMFFSGSVNGLAVGSAVQFRGVKIGEVTEIKAQFNPEDLSFTIPVYIEIDPKSITTAKRLNNKMGTHINPFINKLVAKGLKAQLKMKSYVTGQLFVALDLYPDKPIQLVGIEKRYPEIPTIPSTADVLMATLDKVPVSEIVNGLVKLTNGVEKLVNSPEISSGLENLGTSLKELGSLVRKIDAEVKPLSSSIRGTSDAARNAFVQVEKTLALKEGVPGELAQGVRETLAQTGTTLEKIRVSIGSYGHIAERNTDIGQDLSNTLGEIKAAARSIRSLSEYLERHPEAFVKGKQPSRGE